MSDDDLAELECHLAAGTDLPTAVAALSADRQSPATKDNGPWWIGILIGLAIATVIIRLTYVR